MNSGLEFEKTGKNSLNAYFRRPLTDQFFEILSHFWNTQYMARCLHAQANSSTYYVFLWHKGAPNYQKSAKIPLKSLLKLPLRWWYPVSYKNPKNEFKRFHSCFYVVFGQITRKSTKIKLFTLLPQQLFMKNNKKQLLLRVVC